MKVLDAGLAAHLAGGFTTLAHCWRIERRDGVIMGFTDHDLDLVFAGVTYAAATGFTATAIQDQLGLSVSNLDVSGALSADGLTEADLNGGRFDDAEVTIYRVNWADTSQRTILRKGYLGQVTRGQIAFTSEMRGLATRLDQAAGRIFGRGCAWSLGDSRCGVDLTAAGRHGSGVVTTVANAFEIAASGLSAFTAGALARGRLVWTSGDNDGIAVELNDHALAGSIATLTLMLPMGRDVQVGDAFAVTIGCDNTFPTCVDRFANGENFGGFPHMPGNDYAITYAKQGENNDGGQRT
ncbi:DUF2163 domain-containing protein [uncultured Brevundimonas sp.]|uniref:DUF2163 domain-containing protein n=1 Tax=uncultured Brevundimonas sp. TaxID=213418 RepID=UPI0025FED531|nr:DUF2163 domain-containing protein [uncultured Brevundimonas sp.]